MHYAKTEHRENFYLFINSHSCFVNAVKSTFEGPGGMA